MQLIMLEVGERMYRKPFKPKLAAFTIDSILGWRRSCVVVVFVWDVAWVVANVVVVMIHIAWYAIDDAMLASLGGVVIVFGCGCIYCCLCFESVQGTAAFLYLKPLQSFFVVCFF